MDDFKREPPSDMESADSRSTIPDHTAADTEMRPVFPPADGNRLTGPVFRRGAATVEFAICIPVLALVLFGALEAANGIYLKQILTQVAYETARTVTTPGLTEAEAKAFGQQILEVRKVEGSTIQIDPPVTALTASGTAIRVTVAAPMNENSYSPLWYFRDTSLRANTVMIRN